MEMAGAHPVLYKCSIFRRAFLFFPGQMCNFAWITLHRSLKMKRILLLILACAALFSCSKSGDGDPALRTVLVYIAGANDLNTYANQNLQAMVRGYKSVGGNNNLIVYFDNGSGTPRLFRVTKDGAQTVKEYPGVNSTTAENLNTVILDVLNDFPAGSYGLILWSHANGWTPKGFPLAVKSLTLAAAAYPPTRTFGNQSFNSQNYQIEIPDLAAAIPSGIFDFLITDACLMGGVETVYALRAKASYIITYPTEVIADGLPYERITPDLVASGPVETLCKNISIKFFDYYNEQNGLYRSASVALIKTSRMDELASAVRGAVKGNASVASLPLGNVQHYDLYSRPFMYDLDDFIKQVATTEQYTAFRAALDKTILYEAHTPYFFSLPLNRCCGLSSYIPSDTYAQYNSYYYDTDWYKACYL